MEIFSIIFALCLLIGFFNIFKELIISFFELILALFYLIFYIFDYIFNKQYFQINDETNEIMEKVKNITYKIDDFKNFKNIDEVRKILNRIYTHLYTILLYNNRKNQKKEWIRKRTEINYSYKELCNKFEIFFRDKTNADSMLVSLLDLEKYLYEFSTVIKNN